MHTNPHRMKALIVDDEEPARVELRKLLSVHGDVEVIGESGDVEEALALTAEHGPDVCFLDVRLAGESGFDYVARVGEEGPRIVFVTAFDQHAVRAFECNALDYLLKPVRPERLAETLRRLPPVMAERAEAEDFVFLRGPAAARFVPWAEVRRIESRGNYTTVHVADGTATTVLRTLKNWIDLAPSGQYVRVHRKTLVRRADIRELRQMAGSTRELVLGDGTIVPVGRTYWPQVQQILGMQ